MASNSRVRLSAIASHLFASPTSAPPTVAVTGAAGYVGGWIVKKCLERGYVVRACVRNLSDDSKTAFLLAMGTSNGGRLTLHPADMSVPGAYDAIFKGCDVIFHPAEIFMTFAPGRDIQNAAGKLASTGGSVTNLSAAALKSSQDLVDSVNKSGTVKLVVYTSSILAMMDADLAFYRDDPVVDERRHPGTAVLGEGSYNCTKDTTESFFFAAASASSTSGSPWAAVSANPADVIGPILSRHQSSETWQGKVGGIVAGVEPPQEHSGTKDHRRPWFTVDVRDVAEAQVRIFERLGGSGGPGVVTSGDRFLLTDMTRIHPEDIGKRINTLFPNYDAVTTCKPVDVVPGGFEPVNPVWDRIQTRNDRARDALGMRFTDWDNTITDTVKSLVNIGGVVPRLKAA